MSYLKEVYLYLLLVQSLLYVNARFDVLKREPGFVYRKGSNSAIKMEVFIDLMCYESQVVFPELIKVANEYGPEDLELKIHLFPLPYFRNAHKSAKGAFIIDELTNGSRTNEWLELIFQNIADFTNSATNSLTETQVIGRFADVAEQLGISRSVFHIQMASNVRAEKSARMVHRYGSSRAVLSVPAFYINGFHVPATRSWKADDFKKEIDRILR
ncbi:hypothetical protein LOTGIDRAFT_228355 [Lottia gigantea]|uniref:Thioredoxin-like fold domain-containing protein n=1 Tax=Lottia gigantea TaxID=225164 RepID=V4ASE8_LOTGI|nr:hypothetical protein LOTGIDRAFT_228355 [Lottia gigantea]ESO97795.1 hypothetical protein LOTGIDRAFT_228355 [Lottia gigantea]